jgi:putative SOS response-associated peptidase YedK
LRSICQTLRQQKLGDAFRVGNLTYIPLEAAPDYNIAPTTRHPVIRNNRDTGKREMVAMRWGMVPHFAKVLPTSKASARSMHKLRPDE